MTKNINIEKIVKILQDTYPVHIMERTYQGQPYKVLVSCVLSLRNLDEVTFPIADKLFQIVDTPEKMVEFPLEDLKKAVKSINYYDTKAQNIKAFSQTIVEKYHGKVPSKMEELLEFRGVGRKTANLVQAVGFNIPAIAVDTHMHKIFNRLGYVKTKNADETELALREKLPQKYWIEINPLFVTHGKQICKTIKPWCDVCPIIDYCNQVDVAPRKA